MGNHCDRLDNRQYIIESEAKMRTANKVVLNVGLVSLPLKLVKAQETHDVKLHLLHKGEACEGGRVSQFYKCQKCGETTTIGNIKSKCYEVNKEQFVPLDESDLERLPLKSAKGLEIIGFTTDRPSLIMQEDVYYASPDKGGEKAFALLSKVMGNLGVSAIGKVTFRGKAREHLLSISAYDGVMLVQSLCWADEVRSTEEIKCKDVILQPREIELATKLVESMVTTINLADLKDEYREALERLVESKLNGTVLEAPKEDLVARGDDILAQLEKSLAGVK